MSGEAVCVGVTGHRHLAEVEKLKAAIAEALDRVQAAFLGRALVCVSPLAEGADRLVAEAVLARGGTLHALLPFAVEDCLSDFEGEDSRAQFRRLMGAAARVEVLPACASRKESYEQVGLVVLERSDVVIAVWDGQPAQSQGGTGDIVARALERRMPVLHIKAGNRVPGTRTPTSLGAEQGRLEAHNLPGPDTPRPPERGQRASELPTTQP
ncbi:MAG: hypothetical protein AB7Y46_06820 [Armatimonadota bacterium]